MTRPRRAVAAHAREALDAVSWAEHRRAARWEAVVDAVHRWQDACRAVEELGGEAEDAEEFADLVRRADQGIGRRN